jgi:general secretion pathway protein B
MSMILDALKRSREDGDVSNAVPSIDTSHEFTAKSVLPFIGFQGLAISIGVVACIAIGVLTVQNVSQGQLGEPPLEQDPVVATLAPAEPKAPKTPLQRSTNPVPETSESSLTLGSQSGGVAQRAQIAIKNTSDSSTRVTALYREVEAAPENRVSAPDAMATEEIKPSPLVQTPNTFEKTVVSQSSPVAQSSGDAPDNPRPSSGFAAAEETSAPKSNEETQGSDSAALPLDIAAVVARVQAELGERALAAHPTPLIENLSQQKKNAIPTVMYTGHDWQPGGTSWVTLNGISLQEGQKNSGFEVEEILTDSVILNYGGTVFRLRSLNSWVNL